VNFLELNFLTAALLPEAVALDQRCLGGLWTLDGYQRELDSSHSDLLVLQPFVSHLDGSTEQLPLAGIGCLWAILEEAHITVLGIDPAYQGQGLGQVMLHTLLLCAYRRGLEWATLEVRESNQIAIALYQKFGFQEIGRRRKYYPDNKEDALILWRKGLQQPEFLTALKGWQQQIAERLARSHWQWPVTKDVNLVIKI
jgi:[ribosomal protein S18]-alanine N-acetyltransferase